MGRSLLESFQVFSTSLLLFSLQSLISLTDSCFRFRLVRFSCRQHYFSCFVKANGDVTPCSVIPVSVGNVLKKPLGAIL